MSKRVAEFSGSDDLSDGAQEHEGKTEGKKKARSEQSNVTEFVEQEEPLQISGHVDSPTVEASGQTAPGSCLLPWPPSTSSEQHDLAEKGWIHLGSREHFLFQPSQPFALLSPVEQGSTKITKPMKQRKFNEALRFTAIDPENRQNVRWLCRGCISHGIPYVADKTDNHPKDEIKRCQVCSIAYNNAGEYMYANGGIARVPITEDRSQARMWCCISCSVLDKCLVIQPINVEYCYRATRTGRLRHRGVIYLI